MFGQSPFTELQPSVSCEMEGRGSRSHRKLAFKIPSILEEPCFRRAGSLRDGRERHSSRQVGNFPSSHGFRFPPAFYLRVSVPPAHPADGCRPKLFTGSQWRQPALVRLLPGDSARVLRQRWRDRDGERQREMQRQRDIQTETQRQRETDRETETERDCDRDRQTETQRWRQPLTDGAQPRSRPCCPVLKAWA